MAQHTSSPCCKKFKSQPSARKLLLTVFWDSQRSFLKHYMDRGTTVTSVNYCDMLRREMRSATCTNREGKIVTGCFVTPQCTPSYSTPHHQHHSKTELASSRAPCPQPRPDSFQFPSVWTPQECCKRPSICGR